MTHRRRQPPPPSAPLGTPSYSRTPPAIQEFTIATGGEFARVSFRSNDRGAPREWTRGTVKAFSPRSRSRMLQMFARTDARYLPERATFITLTYHHDWPADAAEWKRNVEELERRVGREHPESWLVWRLEYQARGAPHFHLLVFHDDALDTAAITADWHHIARRCCGWCDRYMVDIRPVETWDQVRRYVSKYTGKVDDREQPDGGGRFWGVKRRKNRTETIHSIRVSEDEAFRIRRLFKRLIRAANGYYRPGGTRSGVWVRCSNETAKRALAYATSALPQLPPEVVSWLISCDAGGDMPSDGTEPSSTPDSGAVSETLAGRTPSRSRLPVFDAQDVQRRWWARLP